jgi:Domain of unknown function DUF11
MRKIALSTVGLAAMTTFAVSTGSDAATTAADLSMTGNVVAGVQSSQSGQEVPFLFKLTNKSTTTSANVSFYFSITNGTASDSVDDYVCPLISNHFNIYPDTPACEPGSLAAGKTTQAAILVTPKSGVTTMSVKACAQNLSSTDPTSSNNCKTLSVKIS